MNLFKCINFVKFSFSFKKNHNFKVDQNILTILNYGFYIINYKFLIYIMYIVVYLHIIKDFWNSKFHIF
jgi:hypothetical protein